MYLTLGQALLFCFYQKKKKGYYTNAIYVHYQVLKILVVIIPELLMNTQGQQRHA